MSVFLQTPKCVVEHWYWQTCAGCRRFNPLYLVRVPVVLLALVVELFVLLPVVVIVRVFVSIGAAAEKTDKALAVVVRATRKWKPKQEKDGEP